MKIQIITCHHVYNLGASLQAYALTRFLSSLGHQAEIIDYRPEYLVGEYGFWSVPNPKYRKNIVLKIVYILAKLPQKIKFLGRKKGFDDFEKKYLKLTSERYSSFDDLASRCPQADVYVAGSDQIWNFALPNGYDRAFYLDFLPSDRRKISYAASMGSMIPEDQTAFFKDMLSRFNAVGVRECASVKLLESLGIQAECVCDPVMLLSRDEWLELASGVAERQEKYVLVYDFDNSDAIRKAAVGLASKHGLRICTMFRSDIADRCFYNAGPEEFLGLIRDAEYVLTNSFHAMVFSFIFRKKFLVFGRKENLNNRLVDFLKMIRCEHLFVTDPEKADCGAPVAPDIYAHAEQWIRKSKQYLEERLV